MLRSLRGPRSSVTFTPILWQPMYLMSNTNNTVDYKELSIFSGLPDSVIQKLTQNSFLKNLKHRELLYRAGDPIDTFAIVTRGAFKLVRPTLRGDDVIMFFATMGDAIGALVMNKPLPGYPITVKSMGPSQALCIPRKTFNDAWADNAEIQRRLNTALYGRLSVIQDDKTRSKSPLPQRISALLIGLLERSDHSEDQVIPIPLTRQEIADALGVTVESVIRVMSHWDQDGIIQTRDQRIEILRLDQIVEFYNQE